MSTLTIRPMPILWLGLDPSLAAFGFSVMGCTSAPGSTELLALGTWNTTKDKNAAKVTADTSRRFVELTEALKDLFDSVQPQVCFVEQHVMIPRMGVYANATKGRLRGIVEALCCAYGVPLQDFHPQAIRKHLGLEKGAEKSEVEAKLRAKHAREIERLRAQVGEDFDDNAFDAGAIAMLGGFHEAVDWHRRELQRKTSL